MSEQKQKEPILQKKSSRREFLKNSGIAVGGLLVGGSIGGLLTRQSSSETVPESHASHSENPVKHIDYTESLQFFRRYTDFVVLSAAVECIFPENELGPGAITLGVPYFIDKQLASPWGNNTHEYMLAPFLPPGQGQTAQLSIRNTDLFVQGLRKLNETSNSEHGKNFDNLETEQKNALLTKFQMGEIMVGNVPSAYFFAKLRSLTLEGLFSDPMYGGNKNMEGWKMKEFPGAQMSYLNEVEQDFKVISPISVAGHMH